MIKNIIKTNKFLSVTLSDGTVIVSTNVSKELLEAVKNASSDNEIQDIMCPEIDEEYDAPSDELKSLYDGNIESDYIEIRGNSAYIPSISELTVPQDFVEAILKAEQDGDDETLQSYLNYWTLLSLNPDSRVRDNVFWFIKKWGIKITKNGMLVTYRNADFKKNGKYELDIVKKVTNDWIKVKGQKKSPKKYTYTDIDSNNLPTVDAKLVKCDDPAHSLDWMYSIINDTTVDKSTFTDHHSHTFTIKLGEPVSMPREETDSEQERQCSQGLHQGAPGWLKQGYYGDVGLVCLVNPSKIVAIPHADDYGKLRCCEYLPIAIAEYDENGDVIENIDETGVDFEDRYLVDYSGKVNNEDLDNYTIGFIRTVGIDRSAIADKIFKIAQSRQ